MSAWEVILTFITCAGLICSAAFLYGIASRILPVKQNKILRVLLFIILGVTSFTVVFITDPVNILYMFPFFALAVFVCTDAPLTGKAALVLIMYTMIMSFNAIVDSCAGEFFLMNPHIADRMADIVFDYRNIIRMIYWLFIWLIVRKFMKRGGYDFPVRLWRLIVMLSVMPFAATMSTIALAEEFTLAWAMGVLPFAAISSLSLMAAIVMLAKNHQLEKEQAFFQTRDQYYHNLEDSQLQVRKLRHDLANHLNVLQGLKEKEAKEYLHSLIESPAMISGKRFCENEVLNMLLSVKAPQMENLKIDADVRISVPDTISVDNVDICALYANCLDNAIEACEKVHEKKRRIQFISRVDQNLLMLKLVNATDGKIKVEKGVIKTGKKDENMHGYGLASIKEITERYDGAMDIDYDGEEFRLIVTIPLSDEHAD